MLQEIKRPQFHTDCEQFEWEIEESVKVIAYDRMELDITYVAACKAGNPISTCRDPFFCPLYRRGHCDKPYPGVELEIKAYG